MHKRRRPNVPAPKRPAPGRRVDCVLRRCSGRDAVIHFVGGCDFIADVHLRGRRWRVGPRCPCHGGNLHLNNEHRIAPQRTKLNVINTDKLRQYSLNAVVGLHLNGVTGLSPLNVKVYVHVGLHGVF